MGKYFALLSIIWLWLFNQASAWFVADSVNNTASGAVAEATSMLSWSMGTILVWILWVVLLIIVLWLIITVFSKIRGWR